MSEELREIDRAVARRLFSQLLGEEIWTDKPGIVRIGEVDPYSTDIAAAFTVVDAMRGRGWYLGTLTEEPGSKPSWYCDFNQMRKGEADGIWRVDRVVQADGGTPCEAIARAALDALESEEA